MSATTISPVTAARSQAIRACMSGAPGRGPLLDGEVDSDAGTPASGRGGAERPIDGLDAVAQAAEAGTGDGARVETRTVVGHHDAEDAVLLLEAHPDQRRAGGLDRVLPR